MTQAIFLSPDILVVRFSAIGDILLTTPLLRALRTRHPGARISMLTKRQFMPLVSDNPNVDEVFGVGPTFRGLVQAVDEIRGVRYTHRLDLHGSLRSQALRLLAPGAWRSYSKRWLARTAFIYTKRNFYREHVPVPERYFEAAGDLDVQPDGGPPEFFLGAESEAQAATWLAQAGVGQQRPLVAMAPGAAHATKRWPVKHWVSLARRLTGTGADVVLVGGPDDSALAGEIVAQTGARDGTGAAGHGAGASAAGYAAGSTGSGGRATGYVAGAAGALSLQGTGAVLKRAKALVSGDTGVMHMATGVGTPVVALFGPTVRQFGFFPYNAPATVLERDLPCRPCSAHGGPKCPLRHHLCLEQITPDHVYTALCRILT